MPSAKTMKYALPYKANICLKYQVLTVFPMLYLCKDFFLHYNDNFVLWQYLWQWVQITYWNISLGTVVLFILIKCVCRRKTNSQECERMSSLMKQPFSILNCFALFPAAPCTAIIQRRNTSWRSTCSTPPVSAGMYIAHSCLATQNL